MKETRVASRYAKSLLGLAIEQNLLDEAYNDMKLVSETCNSSRDLALLLKSPIVKTDKKLGIIDAVFKGKLGKLSQSFINIITNKRREYLLENIADEFVAQYKTHKQIVTAKVTSAVKLDDAIKTKVLALVKRAENKEVELVETIDEDIIGGVIVRVGDKQIDASILRAINDLKQEFNKNPYIAEF